MHALQLSPPALLQASAPAAPELNQPAWPPLLLPVLLSAFRPRLDVPAWLMSLVTRPALIHELKQPARLTSLVNRWVRIQIPSVAVGWHGRWRGRSREHPEVSSSAWTGHPRLCPAASVASPALA